MAEIQRQKTIEGQKHSIAYLTKQELDAMEALRREPGIRGRLARRGKHMNPSFAGGTRALPPVNEGGSESGFGSKRDEDRGNFETRPDVIQGRSTAAGRGGDYTGQQNQQQGGGNSQPAAPSKTPEQIEAERKAAARKTWDADRKSATKKHEEGSAGRERSGYVKGRLVDAGGLTEEDRGVMTDAEGRVEGDDGFNFETAEMKGGFDASTGKMDTEGSLEGIRTDYKGLRDKADYSDTRDDLEGYQDESDKLKTEAGDKFGGYESQISKMPDRGSEVAGLGDQVGTAAGQVGTAAGQMGTMAADATNTSKLMEDRGLFAGQIEAKRKAGEKGKMANLRRSMASAGSSPEEIARAEAEASSGGGQAGREDALAASMGAMQSKQGQMAQAQGMLQGQAGMYGQQAGMYGQQAGMAGQAQNLNLQKTGAQADMYGRGLGAQQGLMNMGAGLANQRQSSQFNELNQQGQFTGGMADMTGMQLQDNVAKENAAQQKDLAERGLLMQGQANAANRPQGPSQQDQLMGLVQTGVSVKGMMACIPEGTKIDTFDGEIAIEDIKVGDFVRGLDNKKDEVLQVHQYKEDPKPVRFVTITFDGWRKVNCCDKHRISGKRAEDYRLQDDVGSREITSIEWYNGVNRSYDLLTASGGYRINGVPVNTMIPEMAEMITESNKNIKLAA